MGDAHDRAGPRATRRRPGEVARIEETALRQGYGAAGSRAAS
jgi:hypothetical protein